MMFALENKEVLVIGLGGRGRAACELLRHQGAKVLGVDASDNAELRQGAAELRPLGIEVTLGISKPPQRNFSLVVVNSAVPANRKLVQTVSGGVLPVISELELGYQQARCLAIVIAGTNGKSTTAELVERVLFHNNRKVVVSGHCERPVCSVVEQTKDLDFLILQANAFQLERTEFLRPAVAVLLNLAADGVDHYAAREQYVRANAKMFANQQSFDWAVVQSEALTKLRELNVSVPGKIITFSSTDETADLYLYRGLIISRLSNWSGPLLDMDHCELRGPHNAENLMATLAVGHVLRLPLENMVGALKAHHAGPHRCELVAEYNGVQFINDSKATNVDALEKALLTVRSGPHGGANVCLVAGGDSKGLDFHEVGPLLAKRVKGVWLIGKDREKIRAAWSLFTPCKLANSLLEAVSEAASSATSGDVVLLSPACSSFDLFRNYQHRGEVFCAAVKSISRGARTADPHIHGSLMCL
jgi:UDP-N-acetylmuramoylalanine--D-glutamate ligase